MMTWKILHYRRRDGRIPFQEWFSEFYDARVCARIQSRIHRLERGNFGDSKSVGDGLFELRFHFGPGYRIYYGIRHGRIVILLCGGDKSSQQKDIQIANVYWQDYLESQL